MALKDMDVSFLTSNRWWMMVFAVIGGILLDPTFPTSPWYVTLGKFMTALGIGHVGVGTFDRSVDKKVEAAEKTLEAAKVNSGV